MRLFVGITDDRWFEYLSGRGLDEVNFWRPKNQNDFRALSRGELFLFKLHAPRNYIVGGGVFVRHTFLPIELAWQAFEEKNGAPDFRTFRSRILDYRPAERIGQQLGCTVLVQPFFWPRGSWIPMPENWPKTGAMVGKTYSTDEPIGLRLFDQVRERMALEPSSSPAEIIFESGARYGEPTLVRPRLGQGAFRVEVTDAYTRRCAITGERTLPALEAAHIRAYSEDGPHQISNGLLLRSDLHHLFDAGYISVTPDMLVKVSRRIREEFENGRDYYALDGAKLRVLPARQADVPNREYLEWHLAERFRS
jgi:putative restriction endonuclease